MSTDLHRLVALAGLVIGLGALVVQFAIMVPAAMADGKSLPAAIVYFFSFFTNLTNILLVLVYLGALMRGGGWLMLFRKPITRATAAATIALVGLYYHFVLSSLYRIEGLLAVSVILMHYVAPVLYVVWYGLWNRTGTLGWTAAPVMLAYPLVYLVVVLGRGALSGEYPYPTFDAGVLGYGAVGVNALTLLVFLIVLNAIAVAVDRSLLSGRRN